MVARPGIDVRRPAVHMHVLNLDLAPRDGGRDERVVELLLQVVEHVRVAFDGGQARELVDFEEEVVERREDGAGLDELIEVARDDEACVWVQLSVTKACRRWVRSL